MKFIRFMFLFALCGCSASQLASFEAAVAKGDAVFVSAEPLACDIISAVDAPIATVACAIMNAAGEVIGLLPNVTEPVTAAQLLVQKHPTTDAIKAKIETYRSAHQ